MNSTLVWLLVGLGAVLLVTWRLVVSRSRAAAMKAARDAAAQAALAQARQAAAPVPAAKAPLVAKTPAAKAGTAPDGVERRSPGRLQADRVIAAEAARRQAAIQKAQNAARAESERRAAAKSGPSAEPAPAARAAEDVTPQAGPKAAPTVVALRAPAPAPAPSDAPTRPLAPVVPISRVASPAASAEPAAVAPTLESAPRTPAPAAEVKTDDQIVVLLADDSKMVRIKTSKLLAAHGFQIVTAVDGLDAVKQLEGSLPDLVITDVDMPGMDGFGLTSHLRRTARTAHIPIVMITSAEDRHREEATRVGVGLVLGKPYPEDALIAHIRSFRFPVAAEREPAAATA
jgi:CheY-like chemotaxis protein